MGNANMIEAVGLSKRYGETQALEKVDLEVAPGAILGVLGPNGAGKTTALRILTTLSTPDGGRAWVAGHDVVAEAAAVRRKIGVTGQDATLDELLTGPPEPADDRRAQPAQPPRPQAPDRELLELFELTGRRRPHGQGLLGRHAPAPRPRASLVMRPPVLFLDEPTTGLDPTSRQRMWGVIRGLVADGATVLLTTQYLDEADALADGIVVIDHGRVIARGTPRELKAATGSQLLEVTLSAPHPERPWRSHRSASVSVTLRGRRPAPLGAGAQRARARGRRAPRSRRRRRAGRRHHRPSARRSTMSSPCSPAPSALRAHEARRVPA